MKSKRVIRHRYYTRPYGWYTTCGKLVTDSMKITRDPAKVTCLSCLKSAGMSEGK